MALMRYRPLQYTLLLLLMFFIMAAVAVLATRSIWIDEATLLMSVYEIDLLDFLHPLPYYNQASPFLPSVVIKLISEVAGTNFILFRILIFSFILICAMPLAISMGFSTLLLIPSFLLFVTTNSVIQQNGIKRQYIKKVATQHSLVFVLMAVTGVALYAFMSYLTMFQMSDEVYRSTGFKDDIGKLKYSIEGAFLHIFRLTIILSITSLFLKSQSTLFKLNLFFVSTVAVVIVLKLNGLYPVINVKHVVWMIPVGVTLIAMYIHVMLSRKDVLGLFLIFFISFFVAKESAGLYRYYIPEINNNNALYAVLENLEPSDILVRPYAQPSLKIYSMKNPALSKHRYFGLRPKSELLSKKRSPDAALDVGRFAEWQFSELPQTRSFFVLISHERSIEHEPAEEGIIALRNTLKKNSCGYESIFKGTLTQLLKVSCAQPGEAAPSGGA